MNIQTDASKITQEELDHTHRMTKIARIGRISAQARAAKMRKQVRILREALKDAHEGLDSAARYLDNFDSETVVEAVEKGLEQAHAALEATK